MCKFTILRLNATIVSGALLVSSLTAMAESPNILSPEEQTLGFKLLTNGENIDGWKHSGNWTIKDGEVTRTGNGGGLVYEKERVPDDFELRFDWKVASGSNSGVYYRPGQYEYQILDNSRHIDGGNPRTSAASVYFCMAPSRDATKSPDTWNSGRIVCKGTVIQHWLNEEKVVDFDYTNVMWRANVDLLRLRGGDLSARGANLSLQDHGDPVWYRNIRLRTIPGDERLVSENIAPQELKAAVLAAERKKLQRILARRKARADKVEKKR